MSKFKINSVRDSKTERKFTFRIRDMYEKYTFEATAKAKDVLEAKQKIKAKLIGWGNMMIMHVEDELGNQYFGNKLYNFKDEDTTEEVIKKTEFAEKVNDRNAYENMNDRCYAATTPQGYSIIETYVDDDNKIYIIAKRPEDYMIAEDYQVSDGTWKKSTNGFASISLAQDELKKSIKNVTRIFDAGIHTEEMARKEIERVKSEISQKEYQLNSYDRYDMQYGSAKSSDRRKQEIREDLKKLRGKLAALLSTWGYLEDSDLECDKDGKNCATIGAVLNGGIQDAPVPTKAVGMDKIIYTMQSDADSNLYFYIGKTYSMKEGEWTYQKFSMLGTSPEELKFNLKAHGWHEVDNGPARVIDNKIYAPIVDADISNNDKKLIQQWWNAVEQWNRNHGNKLHIDNAGADINDLHAAMFDMLSELKKFSDEESKKLLNNGKHLYNKYAISSFHDTEPFAIGDRVLHVAQETKGTVEKVLPNGNIYVKWDSYIKSPNGQTFTAGEENPKITKIIKVKDTDVQDGHTWVPAYSININDWIIPRNERQKQANMPNKGIHWWKVVDISQRNPQSNILSFTLQDIEGTRVKVDIPEDEKVLVSKSYINDKEPIDYNAQEAESILRRGVSAENSAIDEYEPWIMRLKELYNETGEEKYLDAAKAIEDIDNEEKKHVGEFSQALTNFSPEQGKLAVEGMDEVKAEDKSIKDSFVIRHQLGGKKYYSEFGDWVYGIENARKFKSREEAEKKADAMQSNWEEFFTIETVKDARPLDTYIIHSYKGKKEIDAESEDDAVKKYQAMYPDVSTDEMTISKVKRIESWNYGAKLASENRDCDVKDAKHVPTEDEIKAFMKKTGLGYVDAKRALEEDDNDFYEKMQHYTYDSAPADKPDIPAKGEWVWDDVNYDWYDNGRKMYYTEIVRDEKPKSLTAGDVVEETTDPKESKPVEKPQPIKDGFDENKLNAWLRALEKRMVEKYPDNEQLHYKYRANYGPKYIKIIQQDDTGKKDVSVFAFADYDGNIYKAAGWNVPAKGVRATLDNPPLEGSALYRKYY